MVVFLSDPTCAAVEGDRSAFDEYLLLAAKAAELWRRMGKPAALCRGLSGREEDAAIKRVEGGGSGKHPLSPIFSNKSISTLFVRN